MKQTETQIEFEAPIRIESEMNKREHLMARHRRFKAHKAAIWACWPRVNGGCLSQVTPPLLITLTRIAPRKMDDDNAISGMKACRDQIARMLGVDDGDENVHWDYRQLKGKPKDYRIRIRIEHLPIPY